MSRHTLARAARACLTMATLAGVASAAQAQLNVLDQTRTIYAKANANAVVMEPIYAYYPYNPGNPQSGGQYISGYNLVVVGTSDAKSLQSPVNDFGPFSGTVQATATYQNSTVTSTSSASSYLLPDRFELQLSASLTHDHQQPHPANYPDTAGASMNITFRLDTPTTLVLEHTENLVVTEAASSLRNEFWASVALQDGSQSRYFSDHGNALSLDAGDYVMMLGHRLARYDEVGAASLISNTVVRAVPEASTWAMMGLGLSGLALVAHRRRPAAPRAA